MAILLLLGSCSRNRSECPRLSSINLIDRNGFSETISADERLKQYENVNFLENQPYQKVLRVYVRDPQGDIRAVINSYHPNGQPRQHLEVVNNRAFGSYREWYPNGVLKVDAWIVGGTADINTAAEKTWLFDGCSKAWDENGCLSAEIPYSKGELEGISIYYHANGCIWKKIPFTKNQIQGNYEIFLESGQLLQTTEYCLGVKNGTSSRYWDENFLSAEETYQNGLLLNGKYYDLCGNVIAEIKNGNGYRATFTKDSVHELQEYRHGVLEGEVKVFSNDLALIKVYHLKNGYKHGEEVVYNEKSHRGQRYPQLSIDWYEGKIQGITRTWYENGIQESQREMSKNMKNGLATAWYVDGTLMLIEEYDQDKLLKGEYYKRGDRIPVSQISNGQGTAMLHDAEGHFIRKINYYNGRPQD